MVIFIAVSISIVDRSDDIGDYCEGTTGHWVGNIKNCDVKFWHVYVTVEQFMIQCSIKLAEHDIMMALSKTVNSQ